MLEVKKTENEDYTCSDEVCTKEVVSDNTEKEVDNKELPETACENTEAIKNDKENNSKPCNQESIVVEQLSIGKVILDQEEVDNYYKKLNEQVKKLNKLCNTITILVGVCAVGAALIASMIFYEYFIW